MTSELPEQELEEQTGPVSSELELHEILLRNNVLDPYLQRTNYRVGNLSKKEQYLQIKRHLHSIFGEASVGRVIRERAVREGGETARRRLALDEWERMTEKQQEEWASLNLEDSEALGREEWTDRFVEVVGGRIWRNLSEMEREFVVAQYTDLPADWIPPHRRMMEIQQETSTSRNAHLIDSFLGRVREVFGNRVEDVEEELHNLR